MNTGREFEPAGEWAAELAELQLRRAQASTLAWKIIGLIGLTTTSSTPAA